MSIQILILLVVAAYFFIYTAMMFASPLAQVCVSWDECCRAIAANPKTFRRLLLALLLVLLWPIAVVISLPLYPIVVAFLGKTK